MNDCLITLRAVMRDPAELAAAQADIDTAWRAAIESKRFVATGAAARRLRCPRAQKIIVTTENHWSEPCLT